MYIYTSSTFHQFFTYMCVFSNNPDIGLVNRVVTTHWNKASATLANINRSCT